MAKKLYEEEDIRDIACAIREKCGDETAKYKCCDMGDAIRALSASGSGEAVIEPLTITTNGTYTASTGVDGYSPITVNVATGNTSMEDAIVNRKIEDYTNDRVTAIGNGSFAYAFNLSSISCSNATSVGDLALYNCYELTKATFPKATNIGISTFAFCKKLHTVNLPEALFLHDECFRGCTGLFGISMPAATYLFDKCFYGCDNLEYLGCKNIATIGLQCFYGTNLKQADFSNLIFISSNSFSYTPLTTLILRGIGCCGPDPRLEQDVNNGLIALHPLSGTPIAKGEGYIYVPKRLIDEYQESAVWKPYAAQFRVLEDYTVDGTIDGALDETKI